MGGLHRVAKQAADLYNEVVAALAQPPLASHLDKTWGTHVAVKVALYEAQAALCSGDAFRADDQIASEIARLKVCFFSRQTNPLYEAQAALCFGALPR